MDTQLIAHLNFNGRCREAMMFYKECIGGELVLQKVSESPMAAQLSSETGSYILHSSLSNESFVLMASDVIGAGLAFGNNIALCLNCSNEEEIEHFFTKLSSGGKIKTPLHQSVWGATHGELTDKFGINWILNFSKA